MRGRWDWQIIALGILVSLSVLWWGGFWFPGGVLIGFVMAINLLAAHATRYRIQARGQRRIWGLAIAALGILVTLLVITSGHNSEGFQGEPPFAWKTLWLWVKGGLTLTAAGLLVFALFGKAQAAFDSSVLRRHWLSCLALLAVWLWTTGEATYLGDSGMRVLVATDSGVARREHPVDAGCILLFRQRAGVIVLHAGIGLMMFGQWFVTLYDAEEQMTMTEGQTLNYGQDIRSVELAVIRRNSARIPRPG